MLDFTTINFALITIGVILIVLEVLISGSTLLDLLIAGVSFCIGGIIGYLFASWWLGLVICFVLIIIHWLLIRAFLRKKFTSQKVLSNIDKLVNSSGVVVSLGNYYTVKIDMEIWSAESPQKLQVGDNVKVIEGNGAILKVIKLS